MYVVYLHWFCFVDGDGDGDGDAIAYTERDVTRLVVAVSNVRYAPLTHSLTYCTLMIDS